MCEFLCKACGYPSGGQSCDNPACLENPTLNEAHKAQLRANHEKALARAKEEADREEFRKRLRKRGFTPAF